MRDSIQYDPDLAQLLDDLLSAISRCEYLVIEGSKQELKELFRPGLLTIISKRFDDNKLETGLRYEVAQLLRVHMLTQFERGLNHDSH